MNASRALWTFAAVALLVLIFVGGRLLSSSKSGKAQLGQFYVDTLYAIEPFVSGSFDGECTYEPADSEIGCSFPAVKTQTVVRLQGGDRMSVYVSRPRRKVEGVSNSGRLDAVLAHQSTLNAEGTGERVVRLRFWDKSGLKRVTVTSWRRRSLLDVILLRSDDYRSFTSIFNSQSGSWEIGGPR